MFLSSKHTSKRNSISNSLAAHASALVLYAKTNTEFSEYLVSAIPETFKDASSEVSLSEGTWLLPKDDYSAERRLAWLLSEIKTRPNQTTKEAKTILAKRKYWTQPKSPILGIVGVAIIGPTLGIIKSRKRRRNKMRILYSKKAYKTFTAKELATTTTNVSLKLLAKELELSNGNAYRLEPDLAEWCFTDQETTFATLKTEKKLGEAVQFLMKENLPHATITAGNKIVALAISPVVNDDIIDYLEAELVE